MSNKMILTEMYVGNGLTANKTDIPIRKEVTKKSSYNNTTNPVKAAPGALKAMYKLFCSTDVGIGKTPDGRIYVECNLHDGLDRLLMLFDCNSQTLYSSILNTNGEFLSFNENRVPYEYLIPHFVYQRMLDKFGELTPAWESLLQSLQTRPSFIPQNDSTSIIIDSEYFGGTTGSPVEFKISPDEVEDLRYIPSNITDETYSLLGVRGVFAGITTSDTTNDVDTNDTSDDTLSHFEAMVDLKEKNFSLVKEFYDSLSEEDKKLIPTEANIEKYIPTKIFKNVVSIIADGIKEHDMNSQNILLKGGPGTGKSKMGVALAYVFSMPYRYTQGYKTMDASEYRGTTIANNGVLHTNTDTPFVATASRGGLFVDEDNNYSNEGENTVKNSMLIEPYSMRLADQSIVQRHPFSVFMMTANPSMKGARPINEAYKDRHCVIVDLDALQDDDLVEMIIGESNYKDKNKIKKMIDCWHLINKKIVDEGEDADLLTPRSLVYWGRQTRILGDPIEASKYNVLGALCCSEEFRNDIYQTVIMPRFKRR